MFENIERISAPSFDTFVKNYVRQHKPVICTDLFPPEKARSLGTLEGAVQKVGTREIVIQDEYMNALKSQARKLSSGANLRLMKETTTVQQYLCACSAPANANRMCIEQLVSPTLDGLLPIPELCQDAQGGSFNDVEGRFFAGRAGNVAHLHFDSDQRQVIQFHFFGSKHIILFPPQASAQLLPFRNFSSWHLDRLSERERDDLVRKLGGYQCRLRGGESLFMPALIWHYLYYEEAGLSLSLRFGRNEYNRFLGSRCHASFRIQPLGWALVDDTRADLASRRAYREIVEQVEAPSSSPYEKGKAIEELFSRIAQRLYPEMAGEAQINWLEELGVVDKVREWEIDAKGLYRLPEAETGKKAA